jgi:serine/threonine protein kinase
MISFDGAVKIVDFGIAKAAGDARYTRTGTIRGTAGYLSPEMLSGDPIGPASDVFSACSVLFELTSGSPLFPQENIMAISRAIQDAAGIAARIESLAAPAEIRSLLARGLARDPRLRMSAAELRDGLDGYLAENGGPGAPDRIAYYLRGLFAETIARRREAIRRTVQLDGNDPAPTAMVRPSRFRFWRIALITATSAIALFFLLGLLRRPPFAPPFPPGYSGGRPPFPPPGRAGSTAPFPARKRR